MSKIFGREATYGDAVQRKRRRAHWAMQDALCALGVITTSQAEEMFVTDHISMMLSERYSGRDSTNGALHASYLFGGDEGWRVAWDKGPPLVEKCSFEDALAAIAPLIQHAVIACGKNF